MRRRSQPRERHAPGRRHSRPLAADAAAGGRGQYQPDRFSPAEADAAGALRRPHLAELQRADRRRDVTGIRRPLAGRAARSAVLCSPVMDRNEAVTRAGARIAGIDAAQLAGSLDERGYPTLPALLCPGECRALAALYADEAAFRRRVVTQPPGFRPGEYTYLPYLRSAP